jgi:hypothetical protein
MERMRSAYYSCSFLGVEGGIAFIAGIDGMVRACKREVGPVEIVALVAAAMAVRETETGHRRVDMQSPAVTVGRLGGSEESSLIHEYLSV